MEFKKCGHLDQFVAESTGLTTGQVKELTYAFDNIMSQIGNRHPSVLRYLLTDPAAKSHHQNYPGGLTEHNFKLACWLYARVIKAKLDLTAEETCRIAIFHDLCKVKLYKLGEDGKYSYDYEEYKHHSCESVRRLSKMGIELCQRERVCILLHMAGGWWNDEDEAELSESDREFVGNNIRLISAVQWADMKACE